MAKINGVRLRDVAPELLDRVRMGGEADVLWAWAVTRDGESAVLLATAPGLRLVALGGEQRLRWDEVAQVAWPAPLQTLVTTENGQAILLGFRTSRDRALFADVIGALDVAPDADGEVADALRNLESRVGSLEQAVLRIESQLARVAALLESGRQAAGGS